jgi:hypothetical protein
MWKGNNKTSEEITNRVEEWSKRGNHTQRVAEYVQTNGSFCLENGKGSPDFSIFEYNLYCSSIFSYHNRRLQGRLD